MTTISVAPSLLSVKKKARTNPEIEFLLCCTRTEIDADAEERLQELLQQGIDWKYLIEISIHHAVMPLLYQNLNKKFPDAVPKPILSQLRNFFHTNAQRNLYLTIELINLLNLFQENGISAIPFKGPVLATYVYKNLALRQFSDLDILIKPQDIIKVKELLITKGYELKYDYSWQQTFVHSQKPEIAVDLHWELTPLSYFSFKLPDFEALWQRSKLLTIKGEFVINFCFDDLLLILLVQVARGGYEERESLAQICDLAELIRNQQTLNWEELLQQVRTLGLDRPVFISLLLVQSLLNTPLPARVKQAIQEQVKIDPVISIYAVRIQKRLFTTIKSPRTIKLFFQQLIIRGSLSRMPHRVYLPWQFLIFIVRLFITDINQADREFLPLPSSLFFIYYLIRPIRLMSRYGLGRRI